MSGYLHRACRIDHVVIVSRYLCLLFMLAFVAGCSTFNQQPPAPIVEGTVQPVPMPEETPPEPPAAEAPMPETEPHEEKPEPERVPPRKPHKPPPRITRPAPPPPPPEAPPRPLIGQRLLYPGQVKGLLDTEVQRPDGKAVGRAVDLLVDGGGTPRDIVVNLTGFMGVGDRKVNFPVSALRVKPAGQKAAGALELVPAHTPPIDPTKPAQAAPPPGLAPLMDATVLRPNGGKVGRVVDVLIDAGTHPQAAVLDLGNLISPDRRRIAADWSALHFVTKDKSVQIQLDLSDAQLNASPPYAADQPIRAVSPAPPAPPAPPAAASAAPGSSTAPGSNAAAAGRATTSGTPAQAVTPASRAFR